MTASRWAHWREWSLGAKSAAAIAVPLALLLASLGFGYRLHQQVKSASDDVRRALAIQADIQVVNSLIGQSATAVRGYLLSNRDEFLAPHRNAMRELPVTLTSLRRNIRDPEMKTRLQRIQSLLQSKLDQLEDLRAHGRSLSPHELQQRLLDGKSRLDELREEIRRMSEREANLVAEHSANSARAMQRTLWVDGISSVMVLATGLAAFLMLSSGVVRRIQRLTVNAERLVNGEPLHELPTGRDEIGLLANRLHNASSLLAARAEEARAASQAKTQFLSRTSHELRTPLNAILGFAQLLETDLKGSEQGTAQVQQILSAGRHLLALIDDVLDIARIESGNLKLCLEALPLAGLVQEAAVILHPLAQRHDVELRLSSEFDRLAVSADRQRLRQVLLNLLSNGIKYNRAGGEVSVEVAVDGERVRIDVRDTGIGIRPELLPRLFSPFDRLDAEQGRVEGTGLGLAVSRQLARQMGGDIQVQSTPGRGSLFSLDLPRAELAATSVTTPSTSSAESKSPGNAAHRVLAIEDNPSNLALLRALLARRPLWRLQVAPDGETGLREARAARPSLILLDLHLPGAGGEAVLAKLRAEPSLRDTPIVIVSADALPETIERLRAAGVADYLTKPLEVARFFATLDRILAP